MLLIYCSDSLIWTNTHPCRRPAAPPGWRCEAADRYVPPAHLEHVGPSSSAEQAWAVHRETGRLGDVDVLPTRTWHGPVDADRE